MDQAVQSMLFIILGVIPIVAAVSCNQPKGDVRDQSDYKSVIRCVIKVTTMRNQRKVRSSSMSQNEIKSRKELVHKFDKFTLKNAF
eukprot:6477696-Amphidinium_carterae.1